MKFKYLFKIVVDLVEYSDKFVGVFYYVYYFGYYDVDF